MVIKAVVCFLFFLSSYVLGQQLSITKDVVTQELLNIHGFNLVPQNDAEKKLIKKYLIEIIEKYEQLNYSLEDKIFLRDQAVKVLAHFLDVMPNGNIDPSVSKIADNYEKLLGSLDLQGQLNYWGLISHTGSIDSFNKILQYQESGENSNEAIEIYLLETMDQLIMGDFDSPYPNQNKIQLSDRNSIYTSNMLGMDITEKNGDWRSAVKDFQLFLEKKSGDNPQAKKMLQKLEKFLATEKVVKYLSPKSEKSNDNDQFFEKNKNQKSVHQSSKRNPSSIQDRKKSEVDINGAKSQSTVYYLWASIILAVLAFFSFRFFLRNEK